RFASIPGEPPASLVGQDVEPVNALHDEPILREPLEVEFGGAELEIEVACEWARRGRAVVIGEISQDVLFRDHRGCCSASRGCDRSMKLAGLAGCASGG